MIDGYQKMSKVYNDLMKSGKFTAAQLKEEQGEAVDSISELVAMCEMDGFIPRFYTGSPNDKVDRVLQDMQSYTRSLVDTENNLAEMMDVAVKQIEQDKQKEAESAAEAAGSDDWLERELFNEEDKEAEELTDADFAEYANFEEDLAQQDNRTIQRLLDGGAE